MTDREWLEALRAEIAHMAEDMEVQRRAYVELIARSEQLSGDLDRTSAAYIEATEELRRIHGTVTWRLHERLLAGAKAGHGDTRAARPSVAIGDEAVSSPVPSGNTADIPPCGESVSLPVRHVDPSWKPRVSIIVPTRDRPDLLAPLIESLAHTAWDHLEVVFVDNNSSDAQALSLLRASGFRVVRDEGAFNFPRLVARGVAAASGEVLVLLNNDIEARDPHWLAALVDCLAQPRCGVVGGLLLYPDGTIQHIGMAIMAGEPTHVHAHDRPAALPPTWLDEPHLCAAVTGACLAIRRETWDALGGLDPLFAQNYNDVDLCLRAGQAGLACMVTPLSVLTHKESATRGGEWSSQIAADRILFRARWAAHATSDVTSSADDGLAGGGQRRH